MHEKEITVRRLSTDLSRSMEETVAIKNSRSFIVGHAILHPWTIPQKATAALLRALRALSLRVEDTKDLKYATQLYKVADKELRSFENTNGKQTAVVLHLYYADMWDYFKEKISRMDPDKFDLFVSLPVGELGVKELIRKEYPSARIVFVPNRGRDILPFLKIAIIIYEMGYENVLKLHTKKSTHRSDGNEWLKDLVEPLIPQSDSNQQKIFSKLHEATTGVIGPHGQYVSLAVNYEANREDIRRMIKELKSKKISEKVDLNRYDYGFFAGTMFWARLAAIKDIVEYSSNEELFTLERGQIDSTYAHAMERLFTISPELKGLKLYEVDGENLTEIPYITDNIPDWSDVYIGPR